MNNTVRMDLTREESRSSGALLGTFVGDALGMPVEGWPPERIRNEHGRLETMLDARLGVGTYTDDTQMMIALAKSLLACGGVDPDHLAQTFLDHHDRSRGYGQGTTRVFERWRQGQKVREASREIFDGGSFGNGAAMRTAPLGVVYGNGPEVLDDVIDEAAGITHAHPFGRGGAFLQSRAIGLSMDYGLEQNQIDGSAFVNQLEASLPDRFEHEAWTDAFRKMRQILDEETVNPKTVAERLGNRSTSQKSVPAAICSFLLEPTSFQECVTFAVGIGGDTDTIGAMAGAISGGYHGVEAIPDRWWSKLENGPDGRDEVLKLGKRLITDV